MPIFSQKKLIFKNPYNKQRDIKVTTRPLPFDPFLKRSSNKLGKRGNKIKTKIILTNISERKSITF